MLECRLCDYFGAHPADSALSECGFTGVIFSQEPENLDMEYPCRYATLSQYLNRREQERAVESVKRLAGEDWRMIYRRLHVKAETERFIRRAV